MGKEKGGLMEAHEKHQSFETSGQWTFKSLISCFFIVLGAWIELSVQELVAACV